MLLLLLLTLLSSSRHWTPRWVVKRAPAAVSDGQCCVAATAAFTRACSRLANHSRPLERTRYNERRPRSIFHSHVSASNLLHGILQPPLQTLPQSSIHAYKLSGLSATSTTAQPARAITRSAPRRTTGWRFLLLSGRPISAWPGTMAGVAVNGQGAAPEPTMFSYQRH